MNTSPSPYQHYFDKWDQQSTRMEKIKDELLLNGFEEDKVEEITQLYKKKRLEARTRKGFQLIGLGCCIGLLSCISTVLGLAPEYRDFTFYGLTLIGISIALVGGYFVFE